MGMMIGSMSSSSKEIKITLKNRDGSTAGTLTVSKPNKNKSTKKKRLSYSFKKVSSKILTSKTSAGASGAVREARSTVTMLKMKKRSGEYDERELRYALEHAEEMVRIAKKRRKHMEEEERAERGGMTAVEEEMERSEEEKAEEAEAEEQAEVSEEELKKLADELQQLVDESMEDMNEMMEELMGSAVGGVMDEKEVDELKKRHRLNEMRDILEADMKYLKALFDKLAKEKQANTSGSGNFENAAEACGVSLQLGGADVPVETSAPVVTEGANVDVAL